MAGKGQSALAVVTGKGAPFPVGERTYTVLPLKLTAVLEFTTDGLSFGAQLYNLVDPKAKANVDKWLQQQVRRPDGEPLTLEQAMADDWDVEDLKNCLRELAGLSG